MSDLYQEVILEAARHPHHQGQLSDADYVVHELNASCGDVITLYLKVEQVTGRILDLKWEGQGCIISQAAMSELSAKVLAEHLTLTQVQALKLEDILEVLGLEEVSPGRLKCVMLGLKAFGQVQPELPSLSC